MRIGSVPGKIAVFLGSGIGLGYIPWASGTFGTLWGVLLFYTGRHLSPSYFAAGTTVLLFFSVAIAHWAEKELGGHDSGVIVIDEVVGYLVAVIGIPFTLLHASLAFGLFRLFDIWKPFPIRFLDRRAPGGWGVVLDDVVAGIFANIALRLILFLGGKL